MKRTPDRRKSQALPPSGGTGQAPSQKQEPVKPSVGSKLGAVAPTPEQPVRTSRGTFAPGASGNPKGGKPMDPEVRQLARRHAPEALDTLIQIMRTSRSAITRKAAADSLLDRAYGKPNQALTNADGGPLPMDTGSLLMAKLVALTAELEKEKAASDGKQQGAKPAGAGGTGDGGDQPPPAGGTKGGADARSTDGT